MACTSLLYINDDNFMSLFAFILTETLLKCKNFVTRPMKIIGWIGIFCYNKKTNYTAVKGGSK